jgi:integrase
VTPQRIQAFLNAKLAGDLSPRSVQYLHAILRQALGQAYRWNMIARNPVTLVPAPGAARYEVPALSPEDARAVLAAVKGDRPEALITVALALGPRQGEALGLIWEDVSFDAGTLTVRRQLQRVASEWRLVEPRSK